jgi:Tol biopolymer transport system component
MNGLTQFRSKIGFPLALMFSMGLAACRVQDSQAALSTFSTDRVAQEAPVEVRRLLVGEGSLNFNQLDVSPDGRSATAIDWQTGDVAIRDLATGEMRRVSDNFAAGRNRSFPDQSLFSSDGSRIAYAWQTSTGEIPNVPEHWELRSIGVDGTDRKVHMGGRGSTAFYGPEDWSRDGRYVLVTILPDFPSHELAQIVTLDVATNETRVLKTLDRHGAVGAFFSPDGRFVAFDVRADTDSVERDISLVSSDGSQETPLIRTPDHEELLGWLPDGSGILFHRSADDSRAIWKLPLRDGQPSGPPELVKDDVFHMTGFGFSDDAFFYGLTVSETGVHMASFDLETGRVLEPLEPVADLPGLKSDFATWSPDGTRAVYFSAEQGSNSDRLSRIIVRSLTGEVLQDLHHTVKLPAHAAWTAQGLVVWERHPDNRPGFHLVSLETGEATYLREPAPPFCCIPATVSEDGSSFFVAGGSGPIKEYDIAARSERILFEPDWNAQVAFPDAPRARRGASTVSPDGDKILYQVSNGDQDQRAMAIEIFSRSSGETRVIGGLVYAIGAAWSPDGRYVVLDGRLEGSEDSQLLRISVEDGSVIALAEGQRFSRPRVSSDGRHVLTTTGRFRGEIWRMTFNDGG